MQDSNLRRQCHQIYSLTPLTARETPRYCCSTALLTRTAQPELRSTRHGSNPLDLHTSRSQRRDLNPQPVDYKSTALPIELRWPTIQLAKTSKYNEALLPCNTDGEKFSSAVDAEPADTCRLCRHDPRMRQTGPTAQPPTTTRWTIEPLRPLATTQAAIAHQHLPGSTDHLATDPQSRRLRLTRNTSRESKIPCLGVPWSLRSDHARHPLTQSAGYADQLTYSGNSIRSS